MSNSWETDKVEQTRQLEQISSQKSTVARVLGKLTAPFRYDSGRDGYWPVRSDGSIIEGPEVMSTFSGEVDPTKMATFIAADVASDPEGDHDVAAG